jgi:addiction module RelE/StbE family toxin
MHKLLIAESALADMKRIFSYIAKDNWQAAIVLEQEFYDSFELLQRFPFIGRIRPEFTDKPFYFLPVHHNYLAVYTVTTDEVTIQTIIHAARFIPDLL